MTQEYPVGLCQGSKCRYPEPHRHGFDCDDNCECAGIGAITAPLSDDDLQECDWGYCNRPAAALRLERPYDPSDDEVWVSVCSWHAGFDDYQDPASQADLDGGDC